MSDLTIEEPEVLRERAVGAKPRDSSGGPDAGLALRPEVEAYLKRSLAASGRGARGIPAGEVSAKPG